MIGRTNAILKSGGDSFTLKQAVQSYDYTQKLLSSKVKMNEEDYSDENLEIISNLLENLSKPVEVQ